MTHGLRLERYPSAAGFLLAAEPQLLEAEAENNLILGIAREIDAGIGPAPEMPPYFAAVWNADRLAIAAFSTIPSKLGLTRSNTPAAESLLAQDVLAHRPEVDAVVGPEPTVREVACELGRATGRRARCRTSQRIHQLGSVQPLARQVEGCLRLAQPDDIELLARWVVGFSQDIGEEADGVAVARRRIGAKQVYLWEDRQPVSMAGWSGKTAHGVRVNLVYTPVANRGNGYATAGVAALSALLLAEGNQFCCLYTDLANPTSNSIYRRIGYRPVCDAALYRLE
jgi:predicted GNAT family acetyltransferase